MRTGSLFVIFLTVFIDLLGFGIVLPLLPIYGKQFALSDGLTDREVGWTIGLLMSSFSIMQFICMPLWGRLSDRIGRRPVLMVGLLGSTVCYALFGVSTTMRSLVGLFIARIGAGIAGATISTAQAYIADTTTKENRAKGMALIGAAFALGFTLGPMLGAVSLLAGGEVELSPWPGYAASILSGLALLLACFKLPESHQPGAPSERHGMAGLAEFRTALAVPTIGLLLLTSFIAIFSFANFESSLSLQIDQMVHRHTEQSESSTVLAYIAHKSAGYGYTRPEQLRQVAIYAAFTYLGIVLTLAQGFLVRRLAGKISEVSMAMTGGTIALAGFAGLAWTAQQGNFDMLLVAMAVEVTGFAMVNPALQSLISRRSSPELQGGILGVAQSAASLGRILGPAAAMPLFVRAPAAPYFVALGVMAVALGMLAAAARGGHDYAGRPNADPAE